jgi:phosphate transport system substrate-binding protein
MFRKLFLIGWVALFVVGLGGCAGENGSPPATLTAADEQEGLRGRLTLTGSSTVAPLVAEIAKRFEQQHPEVRIDVQMGGSGKGIADARQGLVEIGMASRALQPSERELTAHPIAVDGVCLIAHASNPVETLDDTEVRAIYRDQINDWKAVGGKDLPMTVVHKAEGRATLAVFLEYFQLDNPEVVADVIVGDNQHGIKTVAATPGAIGYVSIGTAQADVAAGVPLKLLPVGGVPPTPANVAAGTFPLSRPLNLVTSGEPSRLARRFIAYCQSEAVDDLVIAQAFVPLQR